MSSTLPTVLDVGEPCRRCRRPLVAADTDDGELVVVHSFACICVDCMAAGILASGGDERDVDTMTRQRVAPFGRPHIVDAIRFCGECQGRRARGRRFRLDQLGDLQP